MFGRCPNTRPPNILQGLNALPNGATGSATYGTAYDPYTNTLWTAGDAQGQNFAFAGQKIINSTLTSTVALQYDPRTGAELFGVAYSPSANSAGVFKYSGGNRIGVFKTNPYVMTHSIAGAPGGVFFPPSYLVQTSPNNAFNVALIYILGSPDQDTLKVRDARGSRRARLGLLLVPLSHATAHVIFFARATGDQPPG